MSNYFELLKNIEISSNPIFQTLQLFFYDLGPNLNSILQKLHILKQAVILKNFPLQA